MADITFFEYPDPFVWWQVVLFLAAVGWGCFIIGCFGVGGSAIMAPLMLLLPGMTPPVAIGTLFVGLCPTSLSRAIQLRWYGRLDMLSSLPISVGAALGAVVGQAVLKFAPAVAVAFFVAFVAIWAGVQIQRKVLKERRLEAAASKAEEANKKNNKNTHDTADNNDNNEDIEDASCTIAPSEAAAAAAIGLRPSSSPIADIFEDEEDEEHASGPEDLEADTRSAREVVLNEELEEEWTTEEPKNDVVEWRSDDPTSDSSGKGSKESRGLATAAKKSRKKSWAAHLLHKEALVQMLIGGVSALISSISGTGGPIILFPIFLMWDPNIPMKTLVAHSTPFAAVVVSFSAIMAIFLGSVDLGFSLLIGSVSIVFTLGGGALMERLGDSSLKLAIGIVLIAVGSMVAIRTFVGLVV